MRLLVEELGPAEYAKTAVTSQNRNRNNGHRDSLSNCKNTLNLV